MRDAKFSDGSPITAEDAAFTIKRIRDSEESLWSDSYQGGDDVPRPPIRRRWWSSSRSPPHRFWPRSAMPGISILSKAAVEADEEAFASMPVASGAFKVKSWDRGVKVVLERNPMFWEADRVKLDGVEWISVPGRQYADAESEGRRTGCGDLRAVLQRGRTGKALRTSPSTRSPRPARIICSSTTSTASWRRRKYARPSTSRSTSTQIVDVVTFGVGHGRELVRSQGRTLLLRR